MSTKSAIKRSESARAATRSNYYQQRSKEINKAEDRDCDSLLLMNPNASEDEQLSPISPELSLPQSDSRDRLGKTGKSRPGAGQSFLKLLVGGLRGKQSSAQELNGGDGTEPVPQVDRSLSDTEEISFYLPNSESEEERPKRIYHLATLPRNDWRRLRTDKKPQLTWHTSSYSPEDNGIPEDSTDSLPSLTVHDKSPPAISPVQSDPIMMSASDSPQLSDTVTQSMDYHSVGLEALEMLHNQLEILVRQDCDEEMGDLMQDKVVETLYKQNNDLQRSLECLQSSDQHLRVSLKMAEMRAQEAEIKLQHSSDRCHKLERDCRWLETEFKILYQKYHDLQKHLQKKAILNQMAMDHKARSQRRPSSAHTVTARRQNSFDTLYFPPSLSSPQRHNSSEVIPSSNHPHPHQSHNHHHTQHSTGASTLPRLHSGSMSHTETRV